jgi:hypothetical protein
MYLTPDWGAARLSVRHLADYSPSAAITGHGAPMRGVQLQTELRQLASQFDSRARPAHGRYRDRPAIMNASGVVDVPPPAVSPRAMAVTGLAIGAAIGLGVALSRRGRAQADTHALSPADDVSLAQGAELAAADGGYDVTSARDVAAAAPSSYIDLR